MHIKYFLFQFIIHGELWSKKKKKTEIILDVTKFKGNFIKHNRDPSYIPFLLFYQRQVTVIPLRMYLPFQDDTLCKIMSHNTLAKILDLSLTQSYAKSF